MISKQKKQNQPKPTKTTCKQAFEEGQNSTGKIPVPVGVEWAVRSWVRWAALTELAVVGPEGSL